MARQPFKRFDWQTEEWLTGSGKILDTVTHEQAVVVYRLEKLQNYYWPTPDQRWPRQRRTRGTIDPVPEWPVGHKLILELEDGRRVVCWMSGDEGGLTGDWPNGSKKALSLK